MKKILALIIKKKKTPAYKTHTLQNMLPLLT